MKNQEGATFEEALRSSLAHAAPAAPPAAVPQPPPAAAPQPAAAPPAAAPQPALQPGCCRAALLEAFGPNSVTTPAVPAEKSAASPMVQAAAEMKVMPQANLQLTWIVAAQAAGQSDSSSSEVRFSARLEANASWASTAAGEAGQIAGQAVSTHHGGGTLCGFRAPLARTTEIVAPAPAAVAWPNQALPEQAPAGSVLPRNLLDQALPEQTPASGSALPRNLPNESVPGQTLASASALPRDLLNQALPGQTPASGSALPRNLLNQALPGQTPARGSALPRKAVPALLIAGPPKGTREIASGAAAVPGNPVWAAPRADSALSPGLSKAGLLDTAASQATHDLGEGPDTGVEKVTLAAASGPQPLGPSPDGAQGPPAPAPAEQIAARAELAIRAGRTEFHLHLEPPELGPVRVHLSATEHSITVRLVVHEESARQLIESQMDSLRRCLQEAGLSLGSCHVARDDSGGQYPQRPPRWLQGPRRLEAPAPGSGAPQGLEPLELLGSRLIDVVI